MQWHLRVEDEALVAAVEHEKARAGAGWSTKKLICSLLWEAVLARRSARERQASLAYRPLANPSRVNYGDEAQEKHGASPENGEERA